MKQSAHLNPSEELDAPSLQTMEGHPQTSMGVWVDNNMRIMMRATPGLLTTQPTRGGAVTAVWQILCKLCGPLPPPAMGTQLPFFGQAGHADPLDG